MIGQVRAIQMQILKPLRYLKSISKHKEIQAIQKMNSKFTSLLPQKMKIRITKTHHSIAPWRLFNSRTSTKTTLLNFSIKWRHLSSSTIRSLSCLKKTIKAPSRLAIRSKLKNKRGKDRGT